jgi:phosphoserine phosphatase RsbX
MGASWGAVCRPKQHQLVSGDTYVVAPYGTSGLLVAAIDGLGGGTEAAHAAEIAAALIKANPTIEPTELLRRSHTALHNTRGAVIGVLNLDTVTRSATYVGVGNIGAHVYNNQAIKPISKNGILGYRLPQLLKLSYTYNFGDTFVLYSDGISGRFSLDSTINSSLAPQELAETILHKHGKLTDDATVVVVRIT